MKTKFLYLIYLFLAPVLSGVLLFLAFPKYDLGWLAWVGLVPLLIVISHTNTLRSFFLSYLCGIIFFAGVFDWGLDIPGYRLHHHVLIICYLGIYVGFFGLILNFLLRRRGITYAYVAAPFVWICIEFIRSNFFFLALPWALLAHSQYQYLPIIQIASLTGTYSISFLIVLVNMTIAIAITAFIPWIKRSGQLSGTLPTRSVLSILTLATVTLTALSLLYGTEMLSIPQPGKKIKVSVLQGNIDQAKKSNPRKHENFIMETYAELTSEAAKDQPTLIVWPEAATPGYVLINKRLLKEIRSIIEEAQAHFLIGSAEYSKFVIKEPSNQVKIGNTALFFSPNSEMIGKYLKIHLVPFGEYIPYAGTIPWPDFIAVQGNSSWDIPGKEYTLFEINGTKFSAVICWENLFPDLFRKFVKNGASFMINITNEGWFSEPALHQIVAISVFRAVENRVFLARAANTGISCFIDPFGRITGRVQKNGKNVLVRGYLTQEVFPSQKKTWYTIYGEAFVYFCIVISVICLVVAAIRPPK
ncbi:MAG: apolipoprotein N-acyltransferase [Nitrospinales bacterium]